MLKALPILSSDALSSVAYGPEAGLAVLAGAGAGALIWNVPIGIAIALLMLIVTASYRQVIRGYQGGGGSYAVARANLGTIVGLTAGAALLVDYVLTVSVSVSSGVDALASAFGTLLPLKIELGLLFVALLALGNLRGVREAGALFAVPTYLFLVSMVVLIVVGLVRGLVFHAAQHPVGQYAPISATAVVTPFLILTAFASGSSSMTGIEAVSNSVPSFEKPEAQNAIRTLTILGFLLVGLFLGVVALDLIYGAEPHPGGNPTVLSEIGAAVFPGSARIGYYVLQLSTLAVLVLAANTSFNGFPRLCAVLARDDFLPHRFAALGNRLVYSSAIVFLAVAAAILMVGFQGNTDALINLYALGVFTAFTLAQAALVRHWWRSREDHWQPGILINGLGAVATAVVAAVVIATKAPRGAWVVMIIVPCLVLLFWSISRFYRRTGEELRALTVAPPRLERGLALVPVFRLDPATFTALYYASALTPDVVAVHIARDTSEAERLGAEWAAHGWPAGCGVPELQTRVAGRRGRVRTFLAAVDEARASVPSRPLTVVLPEAPDTSGLAGQLLHDPTSLRLKLALVRRRGVVAASLPAKTPEFVAAGLGGPPDARPQHAAIVPIADLNAPARSALDYAASHATRVIALYVEAGVDEHHGLSEKLRTQLEAWRREAAADGQGPGLTFTVIASPYRSVVPPVLAYVDGWRQAHAATLVTVVLPELVVHRWWAFGLHNHRAFWLKAALLTRATIAVADVTYHLPIEAAAGSEPGSAAGAG